MNAKDLIKTSKTSEEIFKEIQDSNKNNPSHFKFFIPHFIFVSNDAIADLSRMGFKVSHGEWFRGDTGLIIEW